ncbi:hypothetical protein SDC9_137915 [bioreactor metagenome]|uniref:Uncharacterized protein n=1 Tax=bioreactor metagenome TaxID=1076179 RepID=A0A645DPT7_9ZZZZ
MRDVLADQLFERIQLLGVIKLFLFLDLVFSIQDRIYFMDQFLRLKWLDDVIIHFELVPGHLVIHGITGRQENKGNVFSGVGDHSEGFPEFKPVHFGHHNVTQDQVRFRFLDQFQPFPAVGSGDHFKTCARQECCQPQKQIGFIVHYHDLEGFAQAGSFYIYHFDKGIQDLRVKLAPLSFTKEIDGFRIRQSFTVRTVIGHGIPGIND